MATEAVILPEERFSAGRRIIELTDSVGFDAIGAGWAYARGTGSWRFYLFTPMADTKGPLWIWKRLAKAFSKLHLPDGITPLDIVVESPNESLYRILPVKHASEALGMTLIAGADISGLGYGIDLIWLLRARPEAALFREASRHDSAARRFDLKVRQLMAA